MGMVTTTTVVDEDDKEVAAKVYKTRYPGSNFIGRDGVINEFDYKGEMTVTSYLLQKELDKIAGKPGCPIYVVDYVAGQNENGPVNEIQAKAAAVVASLNAQKVALVNGQPGG